MGKKYTTDEIHVGGHNLNASMMVNLNTVVSNHASYLTSLPSTGIFDNVQIAASIQHAGDTNTWFGFDMGSDIFRVVTNGAERYRVDNDGTGFYGAIGLKNTSSTSKHGIDLYGGAKPNGQPEYGMMFTGTSASGTSGDVTGGWATYFTMNGGADRGWIFKGDQGNTSSISSGGVATFNSAIKSPIFYDSNNTGYFLNPAGISKLYQLRVDEGDGGMNSNFLFGQAGSQEHRLFGAANHQYSLIGSSSPIFKWGQSATDGNHNIKMTLSNSGLNVVGVLTATGGTSTEWNTAYDWGNYSTGVTRGFLHGKLHSTGGDADTYTDFGIYRNYASNGPIASHTTILHVSQTDGNYGYQLAGSTIANDDGLYFRNFASAPTKAGATWHQLATRAWVTSNANSSNANLLDGLNSTQFIRSDANDETGSGIKTWFGGAIDSGSGATIQVNGFQRTGNIYLHSGGNSPDTVRNSDYLGNIGGDLYWNTNGVGNGKVWTSVVFLVI